MQTEYRSGWMLLALWCVVGLLVAGPVWAAESDVAVAARNGDVDAVLELIADQLDVNESEADGSTALLWAAYHQDADMARALIAAGADPQTANRYGVTPLIQASRVGDAVLVEALLDAGADPNLAHPGGETPLMGASLAGNAAAVRMLLDAGAAVNAKEQWQDQTPLMWASSEGHLEIVEVLLEAGADPNAVAGVTLIETRENADHPTGGLTALMFATRQAHSDVVRALLDAGADINAKNPDDATPMIIAIYNDRFDLANMLLELGADPNDGSLYWAVDLHEMPGDFLAFDSNRPWPDHPNELTAMDLMERLLEAGADPDRTFSGSLHSLGASGAAGHNGTPLYRAARETNVDLIRFLLEAGADPNIAPEAVEVNGGRETFKVGETPLMAALGASAAGRYRGGGPGDERPGEAPYDVPYRTESVRDPVEAVKVLVSGGADLDTVNLEGNTALHQAAEKGKVELVQALADAGATLDLANESDLTPLDLAMGKQPAEPNDEEGNPVPVEEGEAKPEVVRLLQELMGLPVDPLPEPEPEDAEAATVAEN